MLNSMKNRRLIFCYILVITLFTGITWTETSRNQKAQAMIPAFWWLSTYQFGGPFNMIGAAILAYPFLVFLPRKEPTPVPSKPEDAPVSLMYYISDCALHKGAESGAAHPDWTVQHWMEQTTADCQWADESTASYDRTLLAPNAFKKMGEAEGLAALADTFCKGTTDQSLKDRTADQCIATFGINVVPDHYQFVVFINGTVEWAVHRGGFEQYPNYPNVGSSSSLDPNL